MGGAVLGRGTAGGGGIWVGGKPGGGGPPGKRGGGIAGTMPGRGGGGRPMGGGIIIPRKIKNWKYKMYIYMCTNLVVPCLEEGPASFREELIILGPLVELNSS